MDNTINLTTFNCLGPRMLGFLEDKTFVSRSDYNEAHRQMRLHEIVIKKPDTIWCLQEVEKDFGENIDVFVKIQGTPSNYCGTDYMSAEVHKQRGNQTSKILAPNTESIIASGVFKLPEFIGDRLSHPTLSDQTGVVFP